MRLILLLALTFLLWFFYSWLLLTRVAAGDFRLSWLQSHPFFIRSLSCGWWQEWHGGDRLPFHSRWLYPRCLVECVFFHLWFSVWFWIDHSLLFCSVSFDHCTVCLFPNYGLWLPCCYLQAYWIHKNIGFQQKSQSKKVIIVQWTKP